MGGGRGRGEKGEQEWLHGLKFINALLGVALPDLAQGLVLVAAQPHVLSMDHVVGRLLGVVPGIGQFRRQSLWGGGEIWKGSFCRARTGRSPPQN